MKHIEINGEFSPYYTKDTMDCVPHKTETPEGFCTTGRGVNLFNNTPCLNPPVTYIFGDPYCKECADSQIKIHAICCNEK